jgi:hypothetical protein
MIRSSIVSLLLSKAPWIRGPCTRADGSSSALLADIEAIGPAGAWLEGVPPGKIGHFAGEARVTDAADMRKVTEDKRLTLIASLVHTAATGVRDDVVTMFCKRMAAIHKRGRDHLEALREAHRA